MNLKRLQKVGSRCYARSTFPELPPAPISINLRRGAESTPRYRTGNRGQEASHLALMSMLHQMPLPSWGF